MKALKNIWVYYILILLPLFSLIVGSKYFHIESIYFFYGMMFYVLIYRPFIDGNRLYYKNVISKKEKGVFKMFFSFYSIKYFKELYLQ